MIGYTSSTAIMTAVVGIVSRGGFRIEVHHRNQSKLVL